MCPQLIKKEFAFLSILPRKWHYSDSKFHSPVLFQLATEPIDGMCTFVGVYIPNIYVVLPRYITIGAKGSEN